MVWAVRQNRFRIRRTPGFSLLELSLVLLILGLIGAVAVPRYGCFLARQYANDAALRLVRDLRMARQHARGHRCDQRVEFDLTQHRYTLPGIPDLARSRQDYEVRLAVGPYRATLQSVEFGSETSVTFNPYGRPKHPGQVILAVGAERRAVIVSENGKVTLK